MRTRQAVAVAIIALFGIGATGCDSTPHPTGENFTTTVQAPPASATATAPSGPREEEELALDIRISDGAVTPTDATVEAKVGQPVIFQVTSDAADELRVATDPPQTFAVEPVPGQVFTVTVDEPGPVAVTLRDLGPVATLQVQR